MRIISLTAILCCFLFVTASCSQEKEYLATQPPKDTAPQNADDDKSCISKTLTANKPNITPFKDSLECIYIEYSKGNIQQLLSLDSQLELLISEIRNTAPKELWGVLWDEKYKGLGLINSEGFGYTGKLKSEHAKFQKLKAKLNPIVTAYAQLPKTVENAERLFALDYEIRRVVRQPDMSDSNFGFFEFKEIGVYIDRAGLKYTGKLMTEADGLLSPESLFAPTEVKVTNNPEFADTLARIYQEYLHLPTEKVAKAEKLVALNGELYLVVNQITKNTTPELSGTFYKAEYSKLGLGIGSYSSQLEYEGKLILDAHAVNPNSRFREETLLAYIYRDVSWAGGHPNPDELYAYLKEFPNNKHTAGIYGSLANFQHGLFAYLRFKPEPSDDYYEYRTECYLPYIAKKPNDEQALAAQTLGIEYYKKAIAESHGTVRHVYANDLIALEVGENLKHDHWCDGIL